MMGSLRPLRRSFFLFGLSITLILALIGCNLLLTIASEIPTRATDKPASSPKIPVIPTDKPASPPNIPVIPTVASSGKTYYVDVNNGSDTNSGTSVGQPWRTMEKAVNTVTAGGTVYIRGGQYNGLKGGWDFRNSGTEMQPITLTNYPGEQVVMKMTTTASDYNLFRCWRNPRDPSSWQTTKADYVHIEGTDVTPRLLSNGVQSKKGIVMLGQAGQQAAAIIVSDCDYWEVAGVDFVQVGYGIFTKKYNWGTMEEHSTDQWNVHDNRVYSYYRESGMQFNGDDNLIENNEIYKVSNELSTPYGCQHLNLLGDHNVVRGNTLSRSGSTARCGGILFEWDLADGNTIERNLIFDVPYGISFQGGDNNVIRNNIIYEPVGATPPNEAGIQIYSYADTKTDWPCNEADGSPLLPANNPAHPDYYNYYVPRNCRSYGNQIYNNTIHGFAEGIHIYPLVGENTIIRNNVFSGWTRGSICFYNASDGRCKTLPADVVADHNADQGNFGFVDLQNYDFHLTTFLIDAGYNLGSLVPDDFDGNIRPQGSTYDIGAYEHLSLSQR